jgi:menaquinone-dependent protoporphyrinogen oxidase
MAAYAAPQGETMKVLVVYDTKHGSSAEIAERIAKAIRGKGGEAETLDLRGKGARSVKLQGYDAVALGGPFYMGMWSRRAKAFATERETELADKLLGLFAIGNNAELGDKAAQAALPAALSEALVASAYVGGRLEYDKLGRFEKFIIRKVSGKAESVSTLDLAKADAFGAELFAAHGKKLAGKTGR